MNKYFPYLTDRPDTQQVVIGGIYWFAYLIFLPGIFRLLAAAIVQNNIGYVIILNIYYLTNFFFVWSIFRKYLSNSFWNVKLHKKDCARSVFSGFAVFLLTTLPIIVICFFLYTDIGEIILYAIPVSDGFFQFPTAFLFILPPILGTCTMLILIPVITSCLYYGVFFAPLWERKPIYGYLSIALVSTLPYLIATFGLEQFEYGLICWMLRLPIHMVSCWVYQRTNSIWGPIFLHCLVNAVSTIVSVFIYISMSLQIFSSYI